MPKVHRKTFKFTVPLALMLFAAAFDLPNVNSARAQGFPLPPPPPPPETSSTGPTSNTDTPPTPSPSDKAQDQSVETFKVGVDVVQLFFNVKDKHGALIPHLNKTDFDLFEDGQSQTIKYFKAESDLPLTLGILLDTSGSQLRVLGMEKDVGGSFLESIMRPKDEAFLISFGTDIELLQDFTSSVSRLRRALNDAQMNAGGVSCAGGPIGPQGPIPCSSTGPRGTALYDAVYLASHDEFSHEVGRKAMILLTDGEDEGSKLKIKDAVEAAQKADAICYVLLIADRGPHGWAGPYSGPSDMKKLTEETGGRVIDVGNKIDKLREAFDQISRELRSQYNIGYTPTNANRDGGFRKVEIKPKQSDYKIQARSGYYATPRHED
jgi:VWFA-related protein